MGADDAGGSVAETPEIVGPTPDDVTTATFLWQPESDRWHWSTALYQLLGYPDARSPVGAELSLGQFLRHQHDGDRGRTEQALERIRRDGQPFVFEHRLVTVLDAVVVVSMSVRRISSRPTAISGILVDVSQARRIYYAADGDTVVSLQAEVARLAATGQTRETISRACGVLIERHKITAEQALELLRQTAQRTARKLDDVASSLIYTGELPAVAVTAHRPKPARRR